MSNRETTSGLQSGNSDSSTRTFDHIPHDFDQAVLDDSHGVHHYDTPTGNRYTSITTILGKTKPLKSQEGLKIWRNKIGEQVAQHIFKESAVIGLQTHELNENYLNNDVKKTDFKLLSYAHHNNFKSHLAKINNIHGIESRLYSDKLQTAGTADCIAEYDGVLSIIDYKTKRSAQRMDYMSDYFIQTTAYSLMWEEITGQVIDQLVILASSEANTMQAFIGSRKEHVNSLMNRLSFYDTIKHK